MARLLWWSVSGEARVMLLALIAAATLIAMPLKVDGSQFPQAEGYPDFHGIHRPGIAALDLVIDLAGRVARCDVVDAGASPRLGSAGCAVARTLRFRPARDDTGTPVAALVRHRYMVGQPVAPPPPAAIDFGIPIDRLPAAATNPELSVYVVTGTDAKVNACDVAHTSGNRALDDLACRTLGTAELAPVRDADGRTIRAIRQLSVGFIVARPEPPGSSR